jgi:hypothetical protein
MRQVEFLTNAFLVAPSHTACPSVGQTCHELGLLGVTWITSWITTGAQCSLLRETNLRGRDQTTLRVSGLSKQHISASYMLAKSLDIMRTALLAHTSK